jgi:hypothetical protein
MTRLEALLDRAAGAQPVTFDAGDVRRRVQQRRRFRRTATGFAVVAMLVGVLGLAHANGNHRVEPLAGTVRPPSLVGRWVPVSIDGEDLETQAQPYVDFRGDGTLGGRDDVCGELAGHWRVDDDRLHVDLSEGDECLQPESPTPLSLVLRAGPTLRAGAEPGTVELMSDEGSAVLRPATGPDAIIDTEVTGHLKAGGVVKATFRTQRSVPHGKTVVATWDLATSADEAVPVRVGVTLTDAPAACHVDGIVLPEGPWEPVLLTPGHTTDTGAAPAHIPAECAGDATLVLILDSDAFVDRKATARVPVTIH